MEKPNLNDEKTKGYPSYTQEDMKVLHKMCREGTLLDDYFLGNGYNPLKLHKFLVDNHMSTAVKILFETEKKGLLKLFNKQGVSTYVSFRMTVSK